MTLDFRLLEDDGRQRWSPFAETRPLGELLFGTRLMRVRLEEWLGRDATASLVPRSLVGYFEDGAPTVTPMESDDAPSSHWCVALSSRFVPTDAAPPPPLRKAPGSASGDTGPRPRPIFLETTPPVGVGWLLPPGTLPPERDGHPTLPSADDGLPDEAIRVDGILLDAPWDLVNRNARQIADDLARLGHLPRHPESEVLGEHPVTLGGDGIQIAPQVALDTREGPIHLESGVRLDPFTHLAGPAWVGGDSTLFGGRIGGVSIGPRCKLRGEISDSVILGYSNKAHDGYLGHALVGRWVNLGAGTTNSDLKNNYSPVRVEVGNDRTVDTGLLKVGVFLGDHVKTGIGTLLNTGTLVGAGSNVFGGRMPPGWVPPFSWGTGDRLVPFHLDRFLEAAERAMARRDRTLREPMRELLTRLWERTHGPVVG